MLCEQAKHTPCACVASEKPVPAWFRSNAVQAACDRAAKEANAAGERGVKLQRELAEQVPYVPDVYFQPVSVCLHLYTIPCTVLIDLLCICRSVCKHIFPIV